MQTLPMPLTPSIGCDEKHAVAAKAMSVGLFSLLIFIGGIIINPGALYPPLQLFHFQFLFAGIASCALLFGILKGSEKLHWTSIQTAYTLFQIVTFIGMLAGSQNLDVSWDLFSNLSLKSWVMLVLLGSLAAYPKAFSRVFGFFLAVVAAFQVHSIKAILAGVEFPGDRFDSWLGQISNADAIGVFFACMVPLQLELYVNQHSRKKKIFLLAGTFASILILIKTQTRAAFLSLIVALAFWLFAKKNRAAKLKLALFIALTVALLGMLPSKSSTSFLDRMSTMFVENATKTDTITPRLYLWDQGLNIWSKFPILGSGLGSMDFHRTPSPDGIDYTGGLGLNGHSLHESFLQTLAERGSLGFIVYLWFLFSIFRSLKKAMVLENREGAPENLKGIATGLRLSLVSFLIGALFISVQESWILIFFAGFASALPMAMSPRAASQCK